MKKRKDSIITSCTNLVLPIIVVLGIYIIIHGHLSPGGGFQGGVLIAGAFAIIYLGYGAKALNKTFKKNSFKIAEDIGVLGFIILAFLGLIFGGSFFNNVFSKGNPGDVFSSGSIFLMNFAVGFKVFAGIAFLIMIMVAIMNKKEEE